jgi:hypothetical protein
VARIGAGLRGDLTSRSKASASRLSAVNRTSLSMITVHDQIEASSRPTSTSFTIQSARRKVARMEKLSGVSALWASMRGVSGSDSQARPVGEPGW